MAEGSEGLKMAEGFPLKKAFLPSIIAGAGR
jgi:hypothetical protein